MQVRLIETLPVVNMAKQYFFTDFLPVFSEQGKTLIGPPCEELEGHASSVFEQANFLCRQVGHEEAVGEGNQVFAV